jgi:hypothetical protein
MKKDGTVPTAPDDEQPELPDGGTVALTGDIQPEPEPTKADELAEAAAPAPDALDEAQAKLVAQRDELVEQMERDAETKRAAQDRINAARPKLANLNRVINSFAPRVVNRKAK